VRDDLDGLAEVVAAPLLEDDLFVDAAGGKVVVARERGVGEALVMTQIEIRLGAVVGEKTSPCWKGDMVPGSTLR